MQEKKTKQKKATEIVEVSAELVEREAIPAPTESQSTVQTSVVYAPEPLSGALDDFPETSLSTQVAATTPVAPLHQKPPMTVLKRTILKALPFVLISLLVFSIPFFNTPDVSRYWLNFAQVRTYILCALIWNLIGAVLYAQVDKRLSRFMIIVVFALPLITSHGWATMLYTVEMALRSILSLPLK